MIRYDRQTVRFEMLVGQRIFSDPITSYDDPRITCAEVKMRPFKPFGIVPGIPWIGFAPWLVAYLVIVIPFVPLLKRVLRIY